LIGVQEEPGPPPDDVDAVVIALKSHTNLVEEAVAESIAALLVAGGRLPAVLLQVLLDLRFHAARQHRPPSPKP
jgi:uncharacterized protein YgbK (DUF1537 family)